MDCKGFMTHATWSLLGSDKLYLTVGLLMYAVFLLKGAQECIFIQWQMGLNIRLQLLTVTMQLLAALSFSFLFRHLDALMRVTCFCLQVQMSEQVHPERRQCSKEWWEGLVEVVAWAIHQPPVECYPLMGVWMVVGSIQEFHPWCHQTACMIQWWMPRGPGLQDCPLALWVPCPVWAPTLQVLIAFQSTAGLVLV